MNRGGLKNSAKERLKGNYGYLILLILPSTIMSILTSGWSQTHPFVENTANGTTNNLLFHWSNSFGSGLTALIAFFVVTGVMYRYLDFYRHPEKMPHPFLQFIYVYQDKGLFLGSFVVGLLQYIWTFLWSLLFLVPGIIKSIAYSQARYIYRDALQSGNKISYTEAITRSRQLMDGHKWEYFVLQLSFLGWYLLVGITAGIASLWVVPYVQMTMSGYYDYLVNQNQSAAVEA